ncbi:MAG: hypothetical protein WAN23_08555 [Candidatus Acidiferrales bacterium]
MRDENVQVPDQSNPALLKPVSVPINPAAAAPQPAPPKMNDASKAFSGKPAGASIADQFLGLGKK